MDLDARLQDAIQHYWDARQAQRQQQLDRGTIDAGSRADVTGGSQMGVLEILAVDILEELVREHAIQATQRVQQRNEHLVGDRDRTVAHVGHPGRGVELLGDLVDVADGGDALSDEERNGAAQEGPVSARRE